METNNRGAHARTTDPDTSHAAAETVNATALEQAVLADLRKNGPATSRELADRIPMDYASVTPRIKPLREKGLVNFAFNPEGGPLRRQHQSVWEAVGHEHPARPVVERMMRKAREEGLL